MDSTFNRMIFFLIPLVVSACWKSEYTRMVERELSKKVRKDNIFLGMYFGMKKEAFYSLCADFNRKKLTVMGKNAMVLYELKNEVGPISMNFYPDFQNDSIYQMSVLFTYKAWSPWQRNTQPDSLQIRIKQLFEKWYGPGFITVTRDVENQIKNDTRSDYAFVKVDGNRQTIIFCQGETDVKAVITDLLVKTKNKN